MCFMDVDITKPNVHFSFNGSPTYNSRMLGEPSLPTQLLEHLTIIFHGAAERGVLNNVMDLTWGYFKVFKCIY